MYALPEIATFLFNAWRTKEHYPFKGIPYQLTITKLIEDRWPYIHNLKKNGKVEIELASSGFANGVISTKDWEKELRKKLKIFRPDFKSTLKITDGYTIDFDLLCSHIHDSDPWREGPSNLEKWQSDLRHLQVEDNIKKFASFFM
jgi:hypothetical protein